MESLVVGGMTRSGGGKFAVGGNDKVRCGLFVVGGMTRSADGKFGGLGNGRDIQWIERLVVKNNRNEWWTFGDWAEHNRDR